MVGLHFPAPASKMRRKEPNMVIISFPDPETRKRALVYLLGRYSGTLLKSGEVIVPENALKPLALQDLVFTVKGKVEEEQVASLRIAAAKSGSTTEAPCQRNGW
jgi:hypothetical protein